MSVSCLKYELWRLGVLFKPEGDQVEFVTCGLVVPMDSPDCDTIDGPTSA